jgi:hypothetical protein
MRMRGFAPKHLNLPLGTIFSAWKFGAKEASRHCYSISVEPAR